MKTACIIFLIAAAAMAGDIPRVRIAIKTQAEWEKETVQANLALYGAEISDHKAYMSTNDQTGAVSTNYSGKHPYWPYQPTPWKATNLFSDNFCLKTNEAATVYIALTAVEKIAEEVRHPPYPAVIQGLIQIAEENPLVDLDIEGPLDDPAWIDSIGVKAKPAPPLE